MVSREPGGTPGVSSPLSTAAGGGPASTAVTRKTPPMTATRSINTRSMTAYVPDHSSAQASPPMTGAQTEGAVPDRSATATAAPRTLPVWNAALPPPMPTTTRASSGPRTSGVRTAVRNAVPNPQRPATPSRAAISCRTRVASTENATAHSSANPKRAPATLAVVSVPGPMKAAVTSRPGPNPIVRCPSARMAGFPRLRATTSRLECRGSGGG